MSFRWCRYTLRQMKTINVKLYTRCKSYESKQWLCVAHWLTKVRNNIYVTVFAAQSNARHTHTQNEMSDNCKWKLYTHATFNFLRACLFSLSFGFKFVVVVVRLNFASDNFLKCSNFHPVNNWFYVVFFSRYYFSVHRIHRNMTVAMDARIAKKQLSIQQLL